MATLLIRNVLFLLVAAFFGIALAQGKPLGNQDDPNFEVLQAVDNKVLDKMRGGFVVDGVKFDIGMQKVVYADGILQAQNSYDGIGNISLNGTSISGREIQNLTSLNTFIQNNLDNRTIQALNVVDVNVKNIGGLQNGFIEAMRGLQNIQLER